MTTWDTEYPATPITYHTTPHLTTLNYTVPHHTTLTYANLEVRGHTYSQKTRHTTGLSLLTSSHSIMTHLGRVVQRSILGPFHCRSKSKVTTSLPRPSVRRVRRESGGDRKQTNIGQQGSARKLFFTCCLLSDLN